MNKYCPVYNCLQMNTGYDFHDDVELEQLTV